MENPSHSWPGRNPKFFLHKVAVNRKLAHGDRVPQGFLNHGKIFAQAVGLFFFTHAHSVALPDIHQVPNIISAHLDDYPPHGGESDFFRVGKSEEHTSELQSNVN